MRGCGLLRAMWWLRVVRWRFVLRDSPASQREISCDKRARFSAVIEDTIGSGAEKANTG